MTSLTIFKLCMTPSLIGLTAFAIRRWGPFVGGGMAGLPTVSGPASLFIALERGTTFAADAALSGMYGVVATCLFSLTYAWLAHTRQRWLVALPAALLVYLASVFSIEWLPSSIILASFLALVGPLLALCAMPSLRADNGPLRLSPRRPWMLPLQMLVSGLMVFSIAEVSPWLGAAWSGILMFFPVMLSIIVPFAHHTGGSRAAILLLRGLLTGFSGGTAFTVTVAWYLPTLGIWLCYTLALCISLCLSFIVTLIVFKKNTAQTVR